MIYACAFLSKDYVFTPWTSLHFDIPHRFEKKKNGDKYQREYMKRPN